ncbi:hypothetical protein J6590_051122 [Homalodisca vitripennis]|nr:hypothetical protein J6590_051122 [Homalodisca vitripennis]
MSHRSEDAYRNFSKIIAGAINQSCPMIKSRKKTRKQSSIANYEAEVLKQEFLQAQIKYLLSGTAEDKITMSNKKKDYDLKLKTLRRQATAVQIQQSDDKTKTIWRVINRERKPTQDTEKSTN